MDIQLTATHISFDPRASKGRKTSQDLEKFMVKMAQVKLLNIPPIVSILSLHQCGFVCVLLWANVDVEMFGINSRIC